MKKSILIHKKDNVVTALTPLQPSVTLSIKMGDRSHRIKVKAPIPFGHKCAIRELNKGGDFGIPGVLY